MEWHDCIPGLDPDPVVGVVADYDRAAAEARRTAVATGTVVEEFARIATGDDLAELHGRTAVALAELVCEVDASLTDLPPVFERLDEIFARHAEQLADLRREAAAALARAQLRRQQRDGAAHRLTGERAELSSIDDQLWWLRSADPAVHADRIDVLERARWSQARRVDQVVRELSTADGGLELSRVEHGRLVTSEQQLVEASVKALIAVELGELADPTGILDRLGAFGGALGSWVGGFAGGAAELVGQGLGALLDGLVAVASMALDAALSALAVAIGVVLLAGVVVAVAVAVAAIAAAAVAFVPFVPLAVTAIALGLIPLPSGPRSRRDSDHGGGDPGGTYTARPTLDWAIASDAELGRAVLTTALDHTADGDRIRADEFEIVTIEGDDGVRRHVVILPGVTDLSSPELGWNPHHRSVRDVDQAALPSSTTTGMDDNAYAVMVHQAMVLHGARPGDQVLLVGHSYGADTALDLAADPRFNGPGAFDVTHVHAAGYHTGPQMPHVPADTQVLATQNAADIVVQVENFGYDVVGSVDSYADATSTLLGGDLGGGLGDLARFTGHVGGLGDPLGGQLTTLVPGERLVAPGQTRIVFAGGTSGAGHDPTHYIEFLDAHTSDAVAAFEASVGTAGYGGPGVARSIDVSVPESGVPSLTAPGG